MGKTPHTAPKWKAATWPLSKLKPWDRNPRAFTEKGLADLEQSIDRFGLAEPIIVNTDGTVIGGHARLTVMQRRGEAKAQVFVPDRTLTPKEVEELNIRLNANIAGEWDWDILANEFDLEDLTGWGLDVPGVDLPDEADTGRDAEAQMDRADELAKSWGVKTGQLWQCGEHRILCGDATKTEDVERVMQGDRACLVFTDPPYGVSQAKKNRLLDTVGKTNKSKQVTRDIVDDDLSPDDLKARLVPAFTNIRTHVMSDDCTVFVTAPQGGELGMMMMMQESGLKVRHMLIWKKDAPTFSMGRLDYDYQHEPILLTWGKRHKRPMKGEHRTSVWEIPKPRSSGDHPTMKPVALVVNALLNNSDPGDVAFDAYSGSGTTMIACEQTGRKARVIEIEPAYVAVALQRFLDATGVKPKLLPPPQ